MYGDCEVSCTKEVKRIYSSDGTLLEEFDTVKTDNREYKTGEYKLFYYDGELKETGYKINGIKEGKYKTYSSNQLREEGTYKEGIRHGEIKEYSSGEIRASGNYTNGVKDGDWTEYRKKMSYENGVEISKKKKITPRGTHFKKEVLLIIPILIIVGVLIVNIFRADAHTPKKDTRVFSTSH